MITQQIFKPIASKKFEPMLQRAQVIHDVVEQCHVEFDDDDLDNAIKEGQLRSVFDISVLGDQGDRSELRFFPPAVREFITWMNNSKSLQRSWLWPEGVMREMLPRSLREFDGQALKGPRLVMAWNCSTELVIDLIRAKHLRQFGTSEFRRGNGGEALIEVSSIETFLSSRRIGGMRL